MSAAASAASPDLNFGDFVARSLTLRRLALARWRIGVTEIAIIRLPCQW
ncbi:MAG: hypothetical protein U1F05_06985 [Burkholderiales bacterium]